MEPGHGRSASRFIIDTSVEVPLSALTGLYLLHTAFNSKHLLYLNSFAGTHHCVIRQFSMLSVRCWIKTHFNIVMTQCNTVLVCVIIPYCPSIKLSTLKLNLTNTISHVFVGRLQCHYQTFTCAQACIISVHTWYKLSYLRFVFLMVDCIVSVSPSW